MTSRQEMIREYIGKKMWDLQNLPDATAELAKLRRGVGKTIEDSPESWMIVLSDMPEELLGTGTGTSFKPSPSERAIHAGLGMFALHCQGNNPGQVSTNLSFAKACRKLIDHSGTNEGAVIRRFDAMISSDGFEELTYHARGMVTMMRSSSPMIGFDYRSFVQDLYSIQFNDGKRTTLLRWGQDFYTYKDETDSNKEETE